MTDWYKLTVDEVVKKLKSNLVGGLSEEEVLLRLERYGLNELVDRGNKSPLRILAAQFTDTMVVILIIAAVVSGLLGDWKDSIAIVAIVIINGVLGFRQEYQAEKSLAALKKMAVPKVKVRRNNHITEISAQKLVPGDIIQIEAGNLIPADCRIIESVNLRAQEAALTGESEPISKQSEAMPDLDLSIGDRINMLYMGTVISYGRGLAIVTETGMHTELGDIAALMQSAGQEVTPLQKRLDQLGKGLAAVALFLVAIVFLLGLWRGEDIRLMFLTSISVAVAAVPEGLPAVVTIALALGARRMLNRKALIRKLPAVETLGSVTVICSDKTGTLTENRMTVTVIDVADHRLDLTDPEFTRLSNRPGKSCPESGPTPEQASLLRSYPALGLLLVGGALCNDAVMECDEGGGNQYHIVGDPTEGALVVAAARLGLEKNALEADFPRVFETPFDSERKRMTTAHRVKRFESEQDEKWNVGRIKIPSSQTDDALAVSKELIELELFSLRLFNLQQYVYFTKGAVDSLLNISSYVWHDNHLEPFTAEWRSRIEASNARLAQQGIRVLGVAFRAEDSPPQQNSSIEHGLTFLGLVGMVDPARPEVKDSVRMCREAGILPKMITGDHPLTARYIASELGILDNGQVLTGQDLDTLSPDNLAAIVEDVSVFARVSPEHKLQIVQALQSKGHITAMTGDGVNDAPALKKADIGVSMGITGTDVAKEASDMVLLDDNFTTIVAAVEEGRMIYDNIRRFIKYLTACNSGEVWVMLIGPLIGMPLPLLPLQILWMNLVTDGLPALALGVEPPERNIMKRRPYPPNENIFSRGLGIDVIWIGLLMSLLALAVGYNNWINNPSGVWQTMLFTTLTFAQMALALSVRSENDTIIDKGLLTNKPLLGAVALTIVLQLIVVYLPPLQTLFGTMPLSGIQLLICIAISSIVFLGVELKKVLFRNRF